MKKLISVLCALALLCTTAGCQSGADSTADYSNSTLTGKVTSIDGTTVMLQLGELSGAGGEMTMPDGEGSTEFDPSAMGGDMGGDMPGGDMAIPDGEGSTEFDPSAMGGDMPDTEIDPGFTMNDGETPPDMPDGEEGAEFDPSAMGDGDMEIPSGEGSTEFDPSAMDGGMGGDMPGGDMAMGGSMTTFTAGEETATIDLSGATVTLESADANTEGSVDDISVDDVLVIEVGDDNTVTSVTVKQIFDAEQTGAEGGDFNESFGGSSEVTQGSAANTIDTDGDYSDETYTSAGDDENALRVDGATVTLEGITVNKESGATSNTEDGDFYGMNAALLATNGANVTIRGITVTSSAQNGNGVFSYGEGTVVTISDSTITTTADNSGGIQTTGGGTTNASNLTVETSGSSSAAIRSDRGGGTVNVDGGTYTSNGYNSPAVYSTAEITVKNAVLTANNSEALVIEGANSMVLEDCTVSGNMSDTNGSSSDINVHNVMIYQSMSGDADVGTSVFTMTGGSLTSNNGDMFYVTNTHCIMTLSGVELNNLDSEGYFLLVSGNDASHGWGSAGSNGAQVELTADAQTIEGDIAVDTISTLTLSLTGGSVLTGSINIIENAENGTAVDDNAVITIDSGCTWNLTGDCTVTSLTNNGTINYNGYTITLADGTVLSE